MKMTNIDGADITPALLDFLRSYSSLGIVIAVYSALQETAQAGAAFERLHEYFIHLPHVSDTPTA